MRNDPKVHESEIYYEDIKKELARANRVASLEQWTTYIAERIKQPIAATMMFAQAASRWLANNPPNLLEVREALDSIVSNARQSSEMLNTFHALVARSPIKDESILLPQLIREAVAISHLDIKRGGIIVVTALEDTLPPVCGDRLQLQQLIQNLIANAVEAMCGKDGHRELAIVARPTESGLVRVEVSDTGPGVDPAILEEFLDPFYSRQASGTGMGLMICNSIVEAHGGSLVAHRRDSYGMTFAFELRVYPNFFV
jgi:C4-dicarboxylate-specific signal transduction histidine kinase